MDEEDFRELVTFRCRPLDQELRTATVAELLRTLPPSDYDPLLIRRWLMIWKARGWYDYEDYPENGRLTDAGYRLFRQS